MKPPLYDEVLDITLAITNASEIEDTRGVWVGYSDLEALCRDNESSERDHPLQWEALADFTAQDQESLQFYQKALSLSARMQLPEYTASIHLALAERYLSLTQPDHARAHADLANSVAVKLSDLELRRNISQFLLDIPD